MALADVIARLSVVLGLDTAAFERGSDIAEKRMSQMQRKFDKLGAKIGKVGKQLSIGLTAPIAGAGVAVVKMTGDFEAAMNRVSISTQATGNDMKAMSDLALQLGKDTIFGATDAADAMDMLAKNGLTTTQILNGAATAAVNLATAGGSELAPAADAITDVMQQFKLTTADLPAVVDQITGAVNESKLDFDDFALAIGQAGGVAGSAGVEFDDFNAAIAATSSLFASGSDAGTSFKTFITRLTPDSKKAATAISDLGLQFFDAQGNMRSMSEIAQELQDKLGGLSEESRTATLKEIFGTDAMRTAIGLMDQGAAGLDAMKQRIAETDAAAQSAKRLEGFNGQLENLKGAVETLAVRIGQSGLLDAVSKVVVALADMIDALSETNPALLKWGTIIAAAVAVVGPLLIGVGAIVSAFGTLLPAIVAVGGAVATFTSIITAGLIPALASFVVAMAPILLPLAAIAAGIGAVYLAWKNWDKIEGILSKLGSGISSWWNGTAVPFFNDMGNRLKQAGQLWWDLHVMALKAVAKLVQGVTLWLRDKLGAVVKWLAGKLGYVGDLFLKLYDRVVGNSYVPDMVDGIRDQMARLDAVMVDPALRATQSTEDAFREMAGNVRQLLDELYPEIARINDFNAKLGLIEGSGLTDAQKADASGRLRGQALGNDGKFEVKAASFPYLPDPAVVQKAMDDVGRIVMVGVDGMKKAWEGLKKIGTQAFAELGYQLEGVIVGAQSLGDALKNLASQLASMLFQSAWGGLGKALKIPGFATGTNFAPGGLALVGERGPELVNLPRGSQVYTNDQTNRMMGMGQTTVNMVVNTPNADSFRRSERQINRDLRRRVA